MKSFKAGEAEIKIRATGERIKVPLDKIVEEVDARLKKMIAEIEAKADALE